MKYSARVLLFLCGFAVLVTLPGSGQRASAGKLAGSFDGDSTSNGAALGAPVGGSGPGPGVVSRGKGDEPNSHAYVSLNPSLTSFGNLPTNPSSGDTIHTGDRFVLDFFMHAQDHGATAAQNYVTYTYQLAGVADVNNLPTSCILVQTVKADFSTFDTVTQNEWCNGPDP